MVLHEFVADEYISKTDIVPLSLNKNRNLIRTFTRTLSSVYKQKTDWNQKRPSAKFDSRSKPCRPARHERDQSFSVPVLTRKRFWSRSRWKKILVPVPVLARKRFWYRSQRKKILVPVPFRKFFGSGPVPVKKINLVPVPADRSYFAHLHALRRDVVQMFCILLINRCISFI